MLSISKGVTMTTGNLLLQCLLTAVVLHSQLVPTEAQEGYRLTGPLPRGPYEGTVEVLRNGQWQTVCDDGWGLNEGSLVCRLLGYGTVIRVYSGAHFGEGAGNIYETEWECTGRENSLEECPRGFTFIGCSDSEAAGVSCNSPSVTTTTPTTSTTRPTVATSSNTNSTLRISDIPVYVWYIVGGVGGSVLLLCLCCCLCVVCGACCHWGKLDCQPCCEDCTNSCCSPCVTCFSACGNCIKGCLIACCGPCLACLNAFGTCCSGCTTQLCTNIGKGLKACGEACCVPFVLCGKCLRATASWISSCTQELCTNIGKGLKACGKACCLPFVLCGKGIKAVFTAIGTAIRTCFRVLCTPVVKCTECLESAYPEQNLRH